MIAVITTVFTKKNYPMESMCTLLPMIPGNYKGNENVANMMGDRETNSAIFNWTIYSNTITFMCNIREVGLLQTNLRSLIMKIFAK